MSYFTATLIYFKISKVVTKVEASQTYVCLSYASSHGAPSLELLL